MTFFAKRTDHQPGKIDVHTTYGPIAITTTEAVGHLRNFWGELGNLLDAVEAEEAERRHQEEVAANIEKFKGGSHP